MVFVTATTGTLGNRGGINIHSNGVALEPIADTLSESKKIEKEVSNGKVMQAEDSDVVITVPVKKNESLIDDDYDYDEDDNSEPWSFVKCGQCIRKQTSTCTPIKETCTGFFPIVSWLPKYRLLDLRGDLLAGLTVGLTLLPQGLAYAKLAGLPEQYGLYSSFISCFVYLILGTSKDITLGPTAIMSLMTQMFATSKSPTELGVYGQVGYAVLLTFGSALIQLIFGFCKLGIVVSFISHPVISAFTSAAAITIAVSQLKTLFGLSGVRSSFIYAVYDTFRKLPETNLADMGLGITCIFLLLLIRSQRYCTVGGESPSRVKMVLKKILWYFDISKNTLVIVLAAIITYSLQSAGIHELSTVKPIAGGLPPLQVPSFSLSANNYTAGPSKILSDIGIGFFIVPVLGLVESIAIGKSFARQNNYRLDADQELVAIGFSNLFGAFVQAYPVTGSFSRTAVNSQSGVRTPAGGLVTGSLVILALAVLTPVFKYVPEAALAAVIICAVLQMTDFSILRKIWRTHPADLIPWVITFFLSFLIGIEYGILVGIVISVLFLLYPTARPRISTSISNGTLLVHLRHGLHFPALDLLTDRLINAAKEDDINAVSFNFSNVTHVDFSLIETMETFEKFCDKRDIKITVSMCRKNVFNLLKAAKFQHVRVLKKFDEVAV